MIISYFYYVRVHWGALSSGRSRPALVEVAVALCICVHCILTMTFLGIGPSGAAVSHLYPISMCPAVPHCVPPWLGGAPMGRALPSRSLLSWWTTVLHLGNGRFQIGDNFCLLLVCCNQLVNSVILLNGRVFQVVKQHCHLLCLEDFLGSCLVGEGQLLEVMRLMLRISANAAVWSFHLIHVCAWRGRCFLSHHASIMFPQ